MKQLSAYTIYFLLVIAATAVAQFMLFIYISSGQFRAADGPPFDYTPTGMLIESVAIPVGIAVLLYAAFLIYKKSAKHYNVHVSTSVGVIATIISGVYLIWHAVSYMFL
ncbi:hypothetical protein FLK61_38660 [Paenalkalicoccus suaedae]|uniref:Uncharacterized protein n=1 Tax=Paenalkalicoccus suaedae TaxID=2592382 RepID=A0A859FII3_9BACI|nr:hypothetical protein [Paenalkalicoccus suaedae]QKS72544.1 hypothetical protein FLK61_38660 [Paenalkalicoccus suaedae]